LTQFTDPLGHSTTYTDSGLNDLIVQSSPDTGTTTITYDVAAVFSRALTLLGQQLRILTTS